MNPDISKIPLIHLSEDNKTILHSGIKCRFIITPKIITVGCSCITVEAAKRILKVWEDNYGHSPDEITIQ